MADMNRETAIIVEQLEHCYDNGFMALQGISFKVQAGDFVALIGQNGAGKTTLVKHLNGLLRPTTGRVTVGGMDAAAAKVSSLARKIGFVFQNPDHQIFNDTVFKEVAFGPANLGLPKAEVVARVEEALAAVDLSRYAGVNPQNLSKGQRQRVALASVLAMKTEIIVLDEPTTGQDYKESLQIMDLALKLNKNGHTVLFITHDMTLVARYARRAIVLCEGRMLMDGPVREVFLEVEKLNRTFLHPPQITELAVSLNDPRLAGGVLTPEELYKALQTEKGGVADGRCG